jgi:hypothetical protein
MLLEIGMVCRFFLNFYKFSPFCSGAVIYQTLQSTSETGIFSLIRSLKRCIIILRFSGLASAERRRVKQVLLVRFFIGPVMACKFM